MGNSAGEFRMGNSAGWPGLTNAKARSCAHRAIRFAADPATPDASIPIPHSEFRICNIPHSELTTIRAVVAFAPAAGFERHLMDSDSGRDDGQDGKQQ